MENEDFDLYGDLDEALIEPLQEEVQKKQAEELEKQKKDENFREETEKIINELKTSNFQLKKNMSLLLATAKSEIDRKDQQIKDLRREMDEIIFRKNKGSKKTCEKWSQTELNESNRSNSSRLNESNKLHDRHKPKEPADSNDRHKRKLSPERRYSDDYRKHRDENGSRSKNYEGRSRKLSLENIRSRSPEKHEKKSTKQELREDDLRKTLLKNKNDDKSSSSNKESTKKTDSSSGRDKYKEKDRIKEKNSSKSEKQHDEKRDKKKSDQKDSKKDKVVKEKLISQKIVKEEVKDPKSNEIDVLISEKSSSSKTHETIVDKTAQEILKLEKVDVMPSNLNLSAESDTNEVPTEKVAIKNVKEAKVEIPTEKVESIKNVKEAKVEVPTEKVESIKNVKEAKVEIPTEKVVAIKNVKEAKVEVPTEKVESIKNVKEAKVEKNEKLPDKPKNCKTKEEAPIKIEETAPKKRKYVPIFEAKIFPGSIETKSDEIKSENVPTAKKEDEQSKNAQKFMPIDKSTSIELRPVTVKIDKSSEVIQKKEETVIITEKITAPITEIMQEIQEEDIPELKIEINSATESLNGSFESTKENSLNNSSEKKKHKKRKIITTELESDGTVVWTLTRKKRKTKEHS